MKNVLEKLKVMPFIGYLLFIGTGLVVFFLAAFFVVLLRTKTSSSVIMPDVVGQSYVEVHNELQRLRLKVRLETKRFPEKNDGEIIYQSISAGKKIEAGSKLYLTVNNGVDRVKMPDLKGQNLTGARSLLDKLLSNETYVSLQIGAITYIPAEPGQLPDTVLGQIPEPDKMITTREKVYLLVTEAEARDKTSRVDDFKGQPFPLVVKRLIAKKSPFKVTEIVPTKDKRESGLVESFTVNSDGSYSLKVNYFTQENRVQSGYEEIKYKVDSDKSYKLVVQKKDSKEETILFDNVPFAKNEEMKFVFYREGDVKVTLFGTDGSKEKSFSFKNEL